MLSRGFGEMGTSSEKRRIYQSDSGRRLCDRYRSMRALILSQRRTALRLSQILRFPQDDKLHGTSVFQSLLIMEAVDEDAWIR